MKMKKHPHSSRNALFDNSLAVEHGASQKLKKVEKRIRHFEETRICSRQTRCCCRREKGKFAVQKFVQRNCLIGISLFTVV